MTLGPSLFGFIVVVPLLAIAAGAATAADLPQPVSPGGADRMARVAEPCPTFSRTAMPEARYDLVVYELGETDGEDELRELFRQRVPGGATTWTPSLDSCLERGGRYA